MELTPHLTARARLVAEINALRHYLNQYGDAPTWTRTRLRLYVNARWDATDGLAGLSLEQLREVHADFCGKLRARRLLGEAEREFKRPSRFAQAATFVS